jgi:hypothetical protein
VGTEKPGKIPQNPGIYYFTFTWGQFKLCRLSGEWMSLWLLGYLLSFDHHPSIPSFPPFKWNNSHPILLI